MGCVAAACARPTINGFRAVGEGSAEGPVKDDLVVRSAAPEDVAAGRRAANAHAPPTAAGLSVGGARPFAGPNPQNSSREPAAIPTLAPARLGAPNPARACRGN